jgi:hypothetical protein
MDTAHVYSGNSQRSRKDSFTQDRRQRGQLVEPEELIDPLSGKLLGRVYSAPCIAEELGFSVRTVERWMKQHGWTMTPNGVRGLTEEQLDKFKQNRGPTMIRRILKTRGYPRQTAEKKVRRWMQDGLSFEDTACRACQGSPRTNGQE